MHLPHFSLQYNVALDLGTAWTRAANPDGMRSSLRSERHGRRGLQAGAVAHASTCIEILREIFSAFRPRFGRQPRVTACVSSCATEEEKRALSSTLHRSGAADVSLIPQPFAAAVGAGLDPSSDYAQMIVDIGEGFTEYAVLRSSRVEFSHTVKLGCGAIRSVITRQCLEAGCACPAIAAQQILQWMETHSSHGGNGETRCLSDVLSGMDSEKLARQLEKPLSMLAEGGRYLFRKLPDRVACEVIENGILLVGGGALLRDLQQCFAEQTGLSVRVPGNPLTAVIDGAAQVIPYLSQGRVA